jgi:hypothetical protein
MCILDTFNCCLSSQGIDGGTGTTNDPSSLLAID